MVHYLKSYVAYFGVSSTPCAVAVVICFVVGMLSSLSAVGGIGGANVIGKSSSKRLLIMAVLRV